MVNQICRMEPAPFMSASVSVVLAFTSTQSALPPERSELDARLETASLRLARPSRGSPCCPTAKAERHTRTATIRIMAILLKIAVGTLSQPETVMYFAGRGPAVPRLRRSPLEE